MLREKYLFLVNILCSQCANGYPQLVNMCSSRLNTYSQAANKESNQGLSPLFLPLLLNLLNRSLVSHFLFVILHQI